MKRKNCRPLLLLLATAAALSLMLAACKKQPAIDNGSEQSNSEISGMENSKENNETAPDSSDSGSSNTIDDLPIGGDDGEIDASAGFGYSPASSNNSNQSNKESSSGSTNNSNNNSSESSSFSGEDQSGWSKPVPIG